MNPLKSVYAAWAKAGKPLLANPFKRKVSIVYRSVHLHGTYVFTFKVGQRDILDAWSDHFVSMLPDGMTAKAIADARLAPQVEILEVF